MISSRRAAELAVNPVPALQVGESRSRPGPVRGGAIEALPYTCAGGADGAAVIGDRTRAEFPKSESGPARVAPVKAQSACRGIENVWGDR
jgi:hypothetical protein